MLNLTLGKLAVVTTLLLILYVGVYLGYLSSLGTKAKVRRARLALAKDKLAQEVLTLLNGVEWLHDQATVTLEGNDCIRIASKTSRLAVLLEIEGTLDEGLWVCGYNVTGGHADFFAFFSWSKWEEDMLMLEEYACRPFEPAFRLATG